MNKNTLLNQTTLTSPLTRRMLDAALEISQHIYRGYISYASGIDRLRAIVKREASYMVSEGKEYDFLDEAIVNDIMDTLGVLWLNPNLADDSLRITALQLYMPGKDSSLYHWLMLLNNYTDFYDFAETIGRQVKKGNSLFVMKPAPNSIQEDDIQSLIEHKDELITDQIKRSIAGIMVELGALRLNENSVYEILQGKTIYAMDEDELAMLKIAVNIFGFRENELYPYRYAVIDGVK